MWIFSYKQKNISRISMTFKEQLKLGRLRKSEVFQYIASSRKNPKKSSFKYFDDIHRQAEPLVIYGASLKHFRTFSSLQKI